MKRNFSLYALVLIIPILLSGCSTNTSANPSNDYDKVSLIEYEACLALWSKVLTLQNTNSLGITYNRFDIGGKTFPSLLELCLDSKPVKE